MNRIILNRCNYFKPLAQISRSEQTQATEYRRPYELNQVQMVGTIEHEIFKFEHTKALRFFLKTRNADESHSVHKVTIVNKNLLEKIGNNVLKLNQAIYIGGRLKTVTEEFEQRQISISEIMANELFFLDQNQRSMEELNLSCSFDQNNVKLLSRITSNISVKNNVTFKIGTTFESAGNPGRSNFEQHRIFVDGSNDLFQMSKLLQRGDRVYLEGSLDYHTNKSKDTGNERVTSFIRPSVIVKLKKGERKETIDQISEENA